MVVLGLWSPDGGVRGIPSVEIGQHRILPRPSSSDLMAEVSILSHQSLPSGLVSASSLSSSSSLSSLSYRSEMFSAMKAVILLHVKEHQSETMVKDLQDQQRFNSEKQLQLDKESKK